MTLVTLINTRKVINDTLIVRQGDPCKFLYFVSFGKFLLLRDIDFIDSINKSLTSYVKENCPNIVDVEKEVSEI